MTSRTEQLTQSLRRTSVFQNLVPMEAGTGWPIPLRKNNRLFVIVPFYGNQYVAEKKQTLLFPLLSAITVDWENGKIVEYVDFQFRCPWEPADWSHPVGQFPHETVQHLTRDAYTEARNSLMTLYDELFSHLAAGTAIPTATGQEFARLLRLLMEPSLEKYYRALGQRFFERFLGP